MINELIPLTEAQPKIQQHRLELEAKIKAFKISSDEDLDRAVGMQDGISSAVKRIAQLHKMVIEPCKLAMQPWKAKIDQANNLKAQLVEPYERLDIALRSVIKSYLDDKARKVEEEEARLREERRKREEEERVKLEEARRKEEEARQKEIAAARAAEQAKGKKAREAAQKKAEAAKAEAAAEAAKAEAAQEALDTKEVQLVEVAPKSFRSTSGALATRKLHWTWEVTDIAKLMKERPDLFIVDEKQINKMVRDGERELPGIRIFQDSTLSMRS